MYSQEKLSQLETFAKDIRISTLNQLAARGFGHLGGAMSMVEILATLYGAELKYDPKNPKWDGRDFVICSKGHSGPSLYSTLALKGFFPQEELLTLNQNGTNLPSHCDRTKTVGIDVTTGSLGQGLSVGVGIALGRQIREEDNFTYVIVGDGELQEGQNWEAIMFAAQSELDNLILFVDNNRMQLDGETASINTLESMVARFEAFNWNSQEVDGHDINAIGEAIIKAKSVEQKPSVIICNTLKGKGVVWAENQFNHHVEVSREAADIAIEALNA